MFHFRIHHRCKDGAKFPMYFLWDIILPPHNFGPKNYPKGGLPQKVCKNPMFYTEPPPYLPNEKKIFFLIFEFYFSIIFNLIGIRHAIFVYSSMPTCWTGNFGF